MARRKGLQLFRATGETRILPAPVARLKRKKAKRGKKKPGPLKKAIVKHYYEWKARQEKRKSIY